MTSIVRGSTVLWTAIFYDEDNVSTDPSAATLVVRYPTTSGPAEATITMLDEGTNWTASWDSSTAEPGVVFWSIKATGLTKIAQQGKFTLTANPAN